MESSTLEMISLVSLVLYALLMVAIVLGNALVLAAIYKFARLRTITSRYMIQLAFVDVLVGLAMPFLIIVMLQPEVMFNLPACHALTFVFTTPLNQTVLIFVLLVADSCAARRSANYWRFSQAKVAYGTIVATWVYSLAHAATSASLIQWSDETGCVYESTGNTIYLTTNSSLLILYLLATGTIHIYTKMTSSTASQQSAGIYKVEGENGKPTIAITALPLSHMLTAFLLTWIPNCLFTIAAVNGAFNNAVTAMIAARMLLNAVIYLNSAVRPLLYAMHNKDMREGMAAVLRCSSSTSQQQDSSSSYARLHQHA